MNTEDLLIQIDAMPLNNDKAEIDLFINHLKDLGFSWLKTAFILIEKLNINVSEAKELTLNSTAWINDKKYLLELSDYHTHKIIDSDNKI